MVPVSTAPVSPKSLLITYPTNKTWKVYFVPVVSPRNMLLLLQPMGTFQKLNYVCKKLLHKMQGCWNSVSIQNLRGPGFQQELNFHNNFSVTQTHIYWLNRYSVNHKRIEYNSAITKQKLTQFLNGDKSDIWEWIKSKQFGRLSQGNKYGVK